MCTSFAGPLTCAGYLQTYMPSPANFALGRVLEALQVDISAGLRLSRSREVNGACYPEPRYEHRKEALRASIWTETRGGEKAEDDARISHPAAFPRHIDWVAQFDEKRR